MLISSDTKLWQLCSVDYQGSSLQSHSPRCLLETFCLSIYSSIYPEGKQVFQHKTCVLYCVGTFSHLNQLSSGRSPPQIQVLRCQPKINLTGRPFFFIAVLGLLTFFPCRLIPFFFSERYLLVLIKKVKILF